MPQLTKRHQFIPSEETRKKWLATRKSGYSVGKAKQLPGFYSTAGFGRDKTWFWFAIFIELLALSITIYGGVDRGGKYILIAALAVFFFVLFDAIGAKLAHSYVGRNKRLENLKEVTPVESHLAIDKQMSQGNTNTWGHILILLSMFLKLFALFLLGRFHIMFYAIFAILYVVVVYVHFRHTGYFLAEVSVQKSVAKDYELYSKSILRRETKQDEKNKLEIPIDCVVPDEGMSHRFKSPIAIEFEDRDFIEAGDNNGGKKHKLFVEKVEDGNSEGDKEYSYELIGYGLILDKDVTSFCNGQSEEAQALIARECVNWQLNKLIQ